MEAYILISALIGGAFLLLLPGYIAQKRNHPYKWIIWALALTSPIFFGVTWFISLIWVLWPKDKNIIDPVVQGLSGDQRTTGDTISEFTSRFKGNRGGATQDRLKEIDTMLENKTISQEEYEKLRKKVLGIE